MTTLKLYMPLTVHCYERNEYGDLEDCANERTGWFGVQLLITPKGRETFRLLCGNTEGGDDASAIQTK